MSWVFFASGSSYLLPIKRLTEEIVFLGFRIIWRFATSPTRFLTGSTTEGVMFLPVSEAGITLGVPPSITATTELVVPRSMPIIFPILRLAVLAQDKLPLSCTPFFLCVFFIFIDPSLRMIVYHCRQSLSLVLVSFRLSICSHLLELRLLNLLGLLQLLLLLRGSRRQKYLPFGFEFFQCRHFLKLYKTRPRPFQFQDPLGILGLFENYLELAEVFPPGFYWNGQEPHTSRALLFLPGSGSLPKLLPKLDRLSWWYSYLCPFLVF